MEGSSSAWIGAVSGLVGATLGFAAAIMSSRLTHQRETRSEFNDVLIKAFELIEGNPVQRAHGISLLKSLSGNDEYKPMILAGLTTQAVNLLNEVPTTDSRIEQHNLFSILEFLERYNDKEPSEGDIWHIFNWNWYKELQNAFVIRLNRENSGGVFMPDRTFLSQARKFHIHEMEQYGGFTEEEIAQEWENKRTL